MEDVVVAIPYSEVSEFFRVATTNFCNDCANATDGVNVDSVAVFIDYTPTFSDDSETEGDEEVAGLVFESKVVFGLEAPSIVG